MRGMNTDSIDLIYLDPPFNSKTDYAAPIGSKAAGAAFKDTWTLTDIDAEWINLTEQKHPALHRILLAATTNSDKSYLTYMAIRLLETHRILKPTGSIYLHCDPTMSHYLKILMDAIFGRQQFRNEVIWAYRRWTAGTKHFQRMHDTILRYTATDKFCFNLQYEPYGDWIKKDYGHIDQDGRRWRWHTVKGNRYKVYLEDENKGVKLNDVWNIPYLGSTSKERLGYPTQKPKALLERIIDASSNEGDIVFDPFCGCATTLAAADYLTREWVGIDISPKAAELVVERIGKQQGGLLRDIIHRTDIPQRTDIGDTPPYNSRGNRQRLYGEQEGNCAGCNTHFEARNLTIDHIIAKSKGGTDHIENLQLLCGNCNSIKGNRNMAYLKTKLQIRS